MSVESLSFTVRPALTHEEVLRACEVRATAYGQKAPEYRESMRQPDAIDQLPWTGIYLCEDKLSGRAVGTMRIQLTRPGWPALAIDQVVDAPAAARGLVRAEITRLAAVPGADPFVRLALWKTGYLHCREHGAALLMIAVRKPALVRAYLRMGARDLCDPVPLPYAGNQVHRIMALDMVTIRDLWRATDHPMLEFMTGTEHPDIATLVSVDRIRPVEHELRVGVF